MFKTRLLTAVIGVPVLLFFVYIGGYFYGLFLAFLAIIGLKEYYSIMKKGGWNPVEVTGYLFLPLAFIAVYRQNFPLLISLWVLFFITFNVFPVFFHSKVKYWESALSFWGIVYTGGLLSFFLAIRLLPDGFYLTLYFLILIWSVDVLAYLVGSSIGKRPIAKKISPRKTVEGTISGIGASCLAGAVMPWIFSLQYLNIYNGAFLGLIVGITGTLGDLSQSVLKRSVNVKDSGDFLPGHGGILDRFDGLLFAAPFFYVFIRYFFM